MTFLSWLSDKIDGALNFVGNVVSNLVGFLEKPFGYLMYFLEGIFYFIERLFQVIVLVIQTAVALFQYFFAIAAGFVRTLFLWLSFDASNVHQVNMPSSSAQGFSVVTDLLQPTGMMTVVPSILLCGVWLLFVLGVFRLLGGSGGSDGE